MGKPAARITDYHLCPMVTPGVPPVPHVGGPVLPPGAPTVLIGNLPAARLLEKAICVGPPDMIVGPGAVNVLISNMPAAVMGDTTIHGGKILMGCFTVLIGTSGAAGGGGTFGAGMPRVSVPAPSPGAMRSAKKAAAPFVEIAAKKGAKAKSIVPDMKAEDAEKAVEQALVDQRKMLEARKKELQTWDKPAKERFEKWFGTTDEKARKQVQDRIDKTLDLNKKYTTKNFKRSEKPEEGTYAYVYPNKDDTVYLDKGFATAPATGRDSRAGALSHEMSHFNSVGGTKDHVYGEKNSQALAKKNSKKALQNADNFEYYLEGG